MNVASQAFRFRLWIYLVVYVLGFTAPWDLALHLDGTGPNSHVWGQLAVMLSRDGAMSISAAFNLILGLGIVCAFAGAWMRTWGSAYLSVEVMGDAKLRADEVVAAGPYAHVRNPLYLGTWLNTLALALLMPPSGAVFTIVVVVAFQIHLILREETYLRGQLSEAYAAYCARVPRLLPALRAQVAASGEAPRWGQAAVAEIFMWGTAVSFAALGWRYDAHLLIQCVLVWLGVSLVVKGVRRPGSGR
jgi:protein-S-isoprenylcysteine O-methyltransferase Ste14